MQYVLFYNPDFCHDFVKLLSPHLLLYCTNSPNISYAMSRLLTFKLPLLSYLLACHRMSDPHAEFIRRSSDFHLTDSRDLDVPGLPGDRPQRVP